MTGDQITKFILLLAIMVIYSAGLSQHIAAGFNVGNNKINFDSVKENYKKYRNTRYILFTIAALSGLIYALYGENFLYLDFLCAGLVLIYMLYATVTAFLALEK